jgi:hypothetical protein
LLLFISAAEVIIIISIIKVVIRMMMPVKAWKLLLISWIWMMMLVEADVQYYSLSMMLLVEAVVSTQENKDPHIAKH